MATTGPAANARAHVRRQNNAIGITFGIATAAAVLGLSLSSGGAAAFTAGFFFKALGLSALSGLIFGAFAQAAADGNLSSGPRVHIFRRNHLPRGRVRVQRRAHVGTPPAPAPVHTAFGLTALSDLIFGALRKDVSIQRLVNFGPHAAPTQNHAHHSSHLHTGPAPRTYTPGNTANTRTRWGTPSSTTRYTTGGPTGTPAHRPTRHMSNH